jgi:beta-lactamase class A
MFIDSPFINGYSVIHSWTTLAIVSWAIEKRLNRTSCYAGYMHALGKFVFSCLLIAVTVLGTVVVLDRITNEEDKDTTPEAITLDSGLLTSSITGIINGSPDLDMSVTVLDLQTGKRYQYGDSSSFNAASIGKLFTATLYLHKVELGQAKLTDTIGADDAQTAMDKLIVESDNTAWHNFNQLLTPDGLQQYAKSLRLNSYDASSNEVNTDDIALLLEYLAQGKLLNNEHTKLLLSFMQRAEMQNFLVSGAPEGATTYHKIGYLSDRLHDAAIVKEGDRSYVLVAFSKSADVYDFKRGAGLFKSITSATSEVFRGTDSVSSPALE